MTLRKAYEMVIRNELDIMIEEKGLNIPTDRLDNLAKDFADDYELLKGLSNAVEEFLEDFGDNYELYDLFD